MLQVNNVSLQYGSKKLFEEVNLKFTKGNCYGIIGANGAGKSTFLKVLSGEIEPNKGDVSLDKNERMSVLAQNQNKYDFETVLRTVMLGHKRLVEIMDEKDALYAHADFTEEDGIRASELESEFAELGGWEAESEAEMLLNELDIPKELRGLIPEIVVAQIKIDFTEVYVADVRANLIEEVAVVRYDDDGVLEIHQIIFEPAHRL